MRKNILNRFKNFLMLLKQLKTLNPLVIHKGSLTPLPPFISLLFFCGHVKNKLTCPADITIILVHNYETEPIAVKSLRYAGIENFIVLKPKYKGAWVNTLKLRAINEYLESDSPKTEYILYIDSVDAILRDNPAKAIQYLQDENCELLFSRTKSVTRYYDYMPDVKKWTDQISRENGFSQVYINAGIFFGKTGFLKEVLNEALKYISDDDLLPAERIEMHRRGTLMENLPEFPKRIGTDQAILRYLHPKFYPRMKIDYKGRLALRT